MIYDTCTNGCGGCDPCGGCSSPCVKPYFNLQNDPYDANYWLWEMGGENGRIKVPSLNETDTKLSTNYSDATLNYNAERHKDTITGAQLGDIINLNDLRDVDAKDPDACSLLVFNPGCGECPCSPDEAMWKKYHIADATEDATPVNRKYKVLTKSDCGCIVEKTIPAIPDIDCLIGNLIKAIKPFEGEGRMIDVQGGGSTAGFSGGLDPHTGDFYISWYDYDPTIRPEAVGQGRVNGKLTATSEMNIQTGTVTYTITQIYYDKMTYTPLYSGSIARVMNHTVWGCFPGTHNLSDSHESLTAQGLRLFTYNFWGGTQAAVTASINKTFNGSYSLTIPAGSSSNWIDVMRLYNDWVIADDDGIVQIKYTNPLDWTQC